MIVILVLYVSKCALPSPPFPWSIRFHRRITRLVSPRALPELSISSSNALLTSLPVHEAVADNFPTARTRTHRYAIFIAWLFGRERVSARFSRFADVTKERMRVRMGFVDRFSSNTPHWQFVIWLRQIILLMITLLPAFLGLPELYTDQGLNPDQEHLSRRVVW